MGRYYDMVKANYNKLRNDESVMWGSIEMAVIIYLGNCL